MKSAKLIRQHLPWSEFLRRGKEWLTKIGPNLMPDRAEDVIAINIETGEYLLEDDSDEDVRFKFRKKWPGRHPYVSRVNGRAAIRFHG